MGKKRNPCGKGFCPAAVRLVWPVVDWSALVAAKAIGKREGTLRKQADALDLPSRPSKKRPKRFSGVVVREAWARADVSLASIAAELGCSEDTLRKRARQIEGLPVRKAGRKTVVAPCCWFREMWLFGVGTHSLARHIGCGQSHVSTMAATLGLPLRHGADRYLAKPTVADFIRDELPRILLARAALAEEAAQVLRFRSENDKLDSKKQGVIKRFKESRGIAA